LGFDESTGSDFSFSEEDDEEDDEDDDSDEDSGDMKF
jgi:hypothetical protein